MSSLDLYAIPSWLSMSFILINSFLLDHQQQSISLWCFAIFMLILIRHFDLLCPF